MMFGKWKVGRFRIYEIRRKHPQHMITSSAIKIQEEVYIQWYDRKCCSVIYDRRRLKIIPFSWAHLYNVEFAGLCLGPEGNLFDDELVGVDDVFLRYIRHVELCDGLLLAECNTWKWRSAGGLDR